MSEGIEHVGNQYRSNNYYTFYVVIQQLFLIQINFIHAHLNDVLMMLIFVLTVPPSAATALLTLNSKISHYKDINYEFSDITNCEEGIL